MLMKTFNFNAAHGPQPLREINVTSLVDVMAVLLIIFMITAPMIQSGVQVRLPRAEATAPDMEEGLVVSVTRDGLVYLEGRQLSLEEFDAVFGAVYTPGRNVFIRGDEAAMYGSVITVIDRLKSHGVENIGLATRIEASEAQKRR